MLRRPKTGGGPAPPSLTASEDALMQAFDGRPQICGLADGIDTDANDGNINNKLPILKSSHSHLLTFIFFYKSQVLIFKRIYIGID